MPVVLPVVGIYMKLVRHYGTTPVWLHRGLCYIGWRWLAEIHSRKNWPPLNHQPVYARAVRARYYRLNICSQCLQGLLSVAMVKIISKAKCHLKDFTNIGHQCAMCTSLKYSHPRPVLTAFLRAVVPRTSNFSRGFGQTCARMEADLITIVWIQQLLMGFSGQWF